jgi:hypothetical protein
METYTTLDNGNAPFKVNINKKTKILTVFKLTKIEFDNNYNVISTEYNKKVVDTKFLNIFIGKSPKNKMTNFSKGYGKKFDGNTILAQIKSNTYMYIGETIYIFEVDNDETILAYQSPVGNNFVPYPYAISNKRVYFLLERKMVELDVFPRPIKVSTKEDLYGFLYDRESLVSISTKKIKKIKNIQGRVSHV